MADGAYDVDSELGAASPTAPTSVALAVAPSADISGGYHITKQPPALPNEPDASLLARAGIAEGGSSPEGQTAVIRAILQRQAVSGKPVRELLTQPGQMQTYWNGALQGVDPSTPAFQSALKIAQTATPSPGVDSWFSPEGIKKQGFGKPPFDPTTGTMIGGQLFGHGEGWGAKARGYDIDSELGGAHPPPATAPASILTPDEQAAWDATGGPKLASFQDPKTGNPLGKATSQQSDLMKFLYVHGISTSQENPEAGTVYNPEGVAVGGQPPSEAGHWYATPQGQLRRVGDATPDYVPVLRGYIAKQGSPLAQIGAGALQGLGMDTLASATRLTGGGLAVGDPMLAAYAQSQGGPSAQETANAAKEYFANQQQNYALREIGSRYAQGGRAVGQVATALAPSALVPELEAPAALRGIPFATKAADLTTNALRGVVAQAPSVGASPTQPVGTQLAMAGIGGAISSEALRALGGLGATLQRLGLDPSKIAPETLDLANKAIGDFGINLRGSQIAGLARDASVVRPGDIAQQQAAWTQAALKEIGASPGFNGFTKTAMASALANNRQMFQDFAARNSITNTDGLLTQLGAIVKKAQDVLPEGEVGPLLKRLQEVGSTIQDGRISGQSFLALTNTDSALARLARLNNNASGFASEMKQAIESAIRREASPQDQAMFDQARAQWKAMKTVEPLAEKGGPAGIVQPQALLQRVVANPFNDDYAYQGAGRFGDLAEIGNTFLKPPGTPKPTPKGGVIPTALGAAGGVGLGEAALQLIPKALQHGPETVLTGGAALAGLGTLWAAHKGVQGAMDALERYNYGPGAGSALAGVARSPGAAGVARKVTVPLSALAGVRLNPTRTLNPAPIGANP